MHDKKYTRKIICTTYLLLLSKREHSGLKKNNNKKFGYQKFENYSILNDATHSI